MVHIVARSPSKLIDSLLLRGLSEPIINDHLTITEGTVTDLDAVRKTIQSDGRGSPMVEIIVSGLGGRMLFSNPLQPTLDNPTICQDGIRTYWMPHGNPQAAIKSRRLSYLALQALVTHIGMSSSS